MNRKITSAFLTAAIVAGGVFSSPVNNIAVNPQTASAAVYDTVPSGYMPVYTIDDLYAIRNNLSGKYILMNDIDLSETAKGGDWDSGNGWKPIGDTNSGAFKGSFDGNGYAIKNIHIFGEPDEQYIGLFGKCDFGSGGYETLISNLALTDVSIDVQLNDNKSADCWVGSVAGYAPNISNCYVTGNISVKYTGNSEYTTFIGGIAGENFRFIKNCFNACNLVISSDCKNNTYHNIGGISGFLNNGGINCCYNVGDITFKFSNSDQSRLYIGDIVGDGYNLLNTSDKLNTSYYSKANPIHSAFDNVSATSYAADSEFKNVAGLTAGQMKSQAAFTGFDFDEIWTIDSTAEYPYPTLKNVPYVASNSTTEPSTEKPSDIPANSIAKCDINGDGKIDSSDASLILKYYAYLSSGGRDEIDTML
ncbi:MAG: hypothetical protein IJ666_02000 [Ruminococcus sp.]|nr:hypothetical protein [Ruminococcus sp.]